MRMWLLSLGCSVWAALCAAAAAQETMSPYRTITVARDGVQNRGSVISSLALSPDGQMMAAAGDDHLVRLWSIEGKLLGEMRGHDDWVRSVDFSPNGRTLITAGDDRAVFFWDMATRRRIRNVPLTVSRCVRMSPAGDAIAGVGFDNRLQIMRADGQADGHLSCTCNDMRAMAFSPDGRLLAAAGRDGCLSVWRVAGRELIAQVKKAHRRRVTAIAFSPDGKWIATGGEGLNLRVWDAQTGEEAYAIASRPGKILSLAFCGDDYLAAGGTHNDIRIWDLRSRDVQFVLVGHSGSVPALAADPRTGMVISGSFDTTIRFWRVAKDGGPRMTGFGDGTVR